MYESGLILSYKSGNLIVSDFEKGFCNFFKKVKKIDFLEYSSTNGMAKTEEFILNTIEDENIQVVLFLQPSGLAIFDPFFLKKISQITNLIVCPWDSEIFFDSIERYYAQSFDLMLVVGSKEYVNLYNLYQVDALHISSLFDSERIKRLELNRDIDILFIGDTEKATRQYYLDCLMSNDFNIEIYGKGSKNGFVTNDEMIKLYNRAKIVLDFSESDNMSNKISFTNKINSKILQSKGRTTEASLCGAFVLKEFNKLDSRYIVGEHVDVFKNKKELLSKINFYLENDVLRKEMAESAYLFSVKNYDCINSFNLIFKTLEKIEKKEKNIIVDNIFLKIYTTQHAYMFLHNLLNKNWNLVKESWKILYKNKFKISTNRTTFLYFKEKIHESFKYIIAFNLRKKLKSKYIKKIVIYAGGEHTQALIKHFDKNIKNKIIGVYDSNLNLHNSVIGDFKISSSSEILCEADTILISSYAFENQIYEELSKKYDDKNIIKLYNGKRKSISNNWHTTFFSVLYH